MGSGARATWIMWMAITACSLGGPSSTSGEHAGTTETTHHSPGVTAGLGEGTSTETATQPPASDDTRSTSGSDSDGTETEPAPETEPATEPELPPEPDPDTVVVVAPVRPIWQIAATSEYFCRLGPDGVVSCWRVPLNPPEFEFTTPSPEPRFSTLIGIDPRYPHAVFLGIDRDRHVHCWGSMSECHRLPLLPPGRYVQLSGSPMLLCGLSETRTIRCLAWSGDPSPPVPPLQVFESMAVSMDNVCAIRPDGTVACYGASKFVFRPPPGRFVQLSGTTVGDQGYVLGLRPDGTVEVWGQYLYQEGGIATPVAPAELPRLNRVWASSVYAIGRTVAGRSFLWNRGMFVELKRGFADVAIGAYGMCGVDESGHIVDIQGYGAFGCQPR